MVGTVLWKGFKGKYIGEKFASKTDTRIETNAKAMLLFVCDFTLNFKNCSPKLVQKKFFQGVFFPPRKTKITFLLLSNFRGWVWSL